ncbi:MAG: tRNA threonylcarbamoyladenosine biosynthesis protein TsaB [Firmicutes bacterium]|nr:tRNA threonylcarbamoyladenosine biosynthesis protein TsaB [Bacillota bacterium]MDI6706125.1 tRNA (adenosine(37)-N6)-threonylcarbamoyltransferase complex dimerization subunit type 1 TsaB [Bacillota bacterium]
MKVLAIDTSSIVASAAVLDGDKLAAEYILNHRKTHSEHLLPIIEEILESCGTDISEIDIIAVASGPGSFTGLRIGAATAKGLAHALGIPVVGVPTLDGLAFNLPYCDGIICPIMDARRNQVYTALYRWEQDGLCRIKDHSALSIEELLTELKAMSGKVIFLGDGVPVHREYIKEILGDRALFAPPNADRQRASSLAELAIRSFRRGLMTKYNEFTPFYLRKSQAEREYEKKQGAQE